MSEDSQDKVYRPRQNTLTESDLQNITSIFEAIHHSRYQNEQHNCRFGNITPEDLTAMVSAHKKFSAAMDDSKTIARRFFLMLILTGVSGLTIKGYWQEIVTVVKRALSAGQ